uniref:G protein-coupled receptor kinase interacting ArfGAP 1 n=1 Tax=Xiphophorus couchianus TaxID=32473 RepID=A0A3B5KQ84_9TELE
MSRKLHRTEVCADCSAPPGWASINRGVLICDECCSVHRSLGRHISIVKHLRHSGWPPTLLQMVQTLASNGANSIWEHSLLDPAQVQSGRRKPNPQDKVTAKSEFIRAKYQMLAFVHKLPCRDDDGVTTKDLSKQLHSSVRTGSLETCLRLLSLGAQANFFHPLQEKGTTPLHVAAKAGQILQAELLVVYGADPGALDINRRTPMDYAQAGHVDLAERLVECQYELTDRLAFYLCGRRPHKNGHYIIPQMADARPKCPTQLDLSELAKAAKKKLQALNNRLFEELAMDVYDEVDRRENDAWLTTQNHSTLVTERSAVPFLPVNPEYSATRNQGRQKLARFNAREFATLIIDILSDAKRRQQGKGLSSPTPLDLGIDDDEHDYDNVASDEDTDSELTTQNNNNTQRSNRAKQSMDSSDLSDGPITLQEYLEVKKALASSEAKVQQLMKVNNNLSEEVRRLQKEITRMQTENSALRGGQQAGGSAGHGVGGPGGGGGGHWVSGGMFGGVVAGGLGGFGSGADPTGLSVPLSASPYPPLHRRDRQAISMYEPGAAPGPTAHAPPALDSLAARLQPLNTEKHGSGTDSDYDNTIGRSSEEEGRGESEEGGGGEAGEPDPTLPCTEDVILKTEQVTKNIQELLRAAQEFKHDSFVPCSEKIHSAVTEMASLFPKLQRPALDAVHCSLRLLASSASRLQVECRKAAPSEPGAPAVDYQLLTQQVIQCAYDIAKAAKQLVTITTREKKQ